MAVRVSDTVVKKMTFSRDLKPSDFKDLREALGNKLVEEGTRHVVVAFDNEIDYLAFRASIGQVTLQQGDKHV